MPDHLCVTWAYTAWRRHSGSLPCLAVRHCVLVTFKPWEKSIRNRKNNSYLSTKCFGQEAFLGRVTGQAPSLVFPPGIRNGIRPVGAHRQLCGRFGRRLRSRCGSWMARLGMVGINRSASGVREDSTVADQAGSNTTVSLVRSTSGIPGHAHEPISPL